MLSKNAPWTAQEHCVCDAKGNQICVAVTREHANTMAASPELLEACVTSLGAYDALRVMGVTAKELPGLEHCELQLKAAIAKAKVEAICP